MLLILVRFMKIGRAREIWQVYHKALARFLDLPALVCTSNLHEPHQNKNHSLNGPSVSHKKPRVVLLYMYVRFTLVANRVSRVFCVR